MSTLSEIETMAKLITNRFFQKNKYENRINYNLNTLISYIELDFNNIFKIKDKKKKDLLLKEVIMVINREWEIVSNEYDDNKENKRR